MCDFVFLTPFSVHFWIFWTCCENTNPYFQWKYKLSAVPNPYLKVINHLTRFKCFNTFIYLKNVRFFVFDPIFSPFLDLLTCCETTNPYFQWKYKLSSMTHPYLKVINHLARFKCFSAFIYRKKPDFVFLTPFSVHFWIFLTTSKNTNPYFQWKYILSAVPTHISRL